MSACRTIISTITRLPLYTPCRLAHKRSPTLISTPAGPLATWSTLKPRPNRITPDTLPDSASDTVLDPLRHPDFFHVRRMFTVSDLFEARVHLGHKLGQLNPYMAEYLVGHRHEVCVFDLDRTARLLRAALNITAHIVSRGGIVLFVCKYGQHAHLVEKTARECGEYAHCHHWMRGTLTDAWRAFGGLMRMPDLVILLNTRETAIDMHQVVTDAGKMAIPLVGVVDSNADPRLVTYPVPGNDDSPAAIALYCRLFAEAIRRGKAMIPASEEGQDEEDGLASEEEERSY